MSEIRVAEVGGATARERPDVALVVLDKSSEHALDMITAIVRESYCPVITLLPNYDSGFIERASRRGVFAYIVDSSPEELQSAIDITFRRFADHQRLQGAFDRRKAEEERKTELRLLRQWQVLELHDGVVQQLTIAQAAHELGQLDTSHAALLAALGNARSVVSRSIVELQADGVPLDQLIADAAPVSE